MEFNPSKCQVVRVTSSRNLLQMQYILHGQVLEAGSSARYLGWISPATSARTLIWTESQPMQTGLSDLLKEISKLSPPPPKSEKMAYQSLVRPQLEYASAVWDPHTKDKTHKVEMVQRRAARWTLNDYARTTSVTSLQSQLNWQTLEERRSVARLCLFYKIVNGLAAVPLPDYMQPTHRISRYCHSMTFRQIHTGKDYYKYSSFHWLLSSGIPSQPMLQLLQVFRSSRQQLDNCSIPNPRQYTAYFSMILIVLDPPLFISFKYCLH